VGRLVPEAARPHPRMGRKPAAWAAVDRDYEQIRIGMHTLFADLGISAAAA
jgi:hypothetical protein